MPFASDTTELNQCIKLARSIIKNTIVYTNVTLEFIIYEVADKTHL